jgi:hypothetical protein
LSGEGHLGVDGDSDPGERLRRLPHALVGAVDGEIEQRLDATLLRHDAALLLHAANGVEHAADELAAVVAVGAREGDQRGGDALLGQHLDALGHKVGVVQLVLLGDVVLGKLGQLHHLRHQFLLVVCVHQVHQYCNDCVDASVAAGLSTDSSKLKFEV